MLSIEPLQELTKYLRIMQYTTFLVYPIKPCQVGIYVDDNLSVEQEALIFSSKVLRYGLPQIACSIVATGRASLDIAIRKLASTMSFG